MGRGERAASSAIGAYQRWVSPHKGFACACRVHEGRASCSAFARRAIGVHGLWRGLAVSRARLRRCGEVHRRVHGTPAITTSRRALRQRGDCDPGCSACDLPGGSGGGSGSGRRGSCFNALDCADCGCDSCLDDRRDRDTLAEWGPTILWALTVLLIVGLGLVVVGCRAGSCDAEAWAFPAWWAGLGLTGLFGVLVFVLRIRREMALITTLAAAPVLAALAFVAAGGVHAWARWFGL